MATIPVAGTAPASGVTDHRDGHATPDEVTVSTVSAAMAGVENLEMAAKRDVAGQRGRDDRARDDRSPDGAPARRGHRRVRPPGRDPVAGSHAAGGIRVIDVGPASASARSHVPTTPVGPAPDPSAALDRRIRAESVVWLTTVSSGGRPHIVPIWFRWDGQTFLLFTKPEAGKVRNIRSNPAVMLALGDPTADFDVLLVEGVADVLELPASDLVPESFFHEYAARMANVGLSRDGFLATYSLAIRIRPTRYLGWAGRSHLVERRQESTLPPR